ncbi:hypothetical protein [Virgibacillus doumboii]|uniref:hypothetical protein n=1 Tax=Virgibacillus doumboii TaxID=2697503 RepID=UPI0013E0A0BC|nr:hypothetical protein [Virgibacillus doumboii]
MSENRISTIIEEINYWKEHKLLPDVYCDFLLALYTNGEASAEEATAKSGMNFIHVVQHILLVSLLPFSFLVVYFTEFHVLLIISILLLFVIFSFWMFRNNKRDSLTYHLSLATILMLILLMSVYVAANSNVSQWFLQLLVFCNFILWYYFGYKNRIKYLKIVSVIGILFVILYIMLQKFHILSL